MSSLAIRTYFLLSLLALPTVHASTDASSTNPLTRYPTLKETVLDLRTQLEELAALLSLPTTDKALQEHEPLSGLLPAVCFQAGWVSGRFGAFAEANESKIYAITGKDRSGKYKTPSDLILTLQAVNQIMVIASRDLTASCVALPQQESDRIDNKQLFRLLQGAAVKLARLGLQIHRELDPKDKSKIRDQIIADYEQIDEVTRDQLKRPVRFSEIESM